MTEAETMIDSDAEAVALLRRLTRSHGSIERRDALAKLAVEIHPAGMASSPWMEDVLSATFADLPSEAHVKAVDLLFGESGRDLKLSYRQRWAGEALGYGWERFRKVYMDRFLLEVVAGLRAHATVVEGHNDDVATTVENDAEPELLVAEAIKSVDQAVILNGNFLLVKFAGRVLAATLSTASMTKFRADRAAMLRNPALAMEFLISGQKDDD